MIRFTFGIGFDIYQSMLRLLLITIFAFTLSLDVRGQGVKDRIEVLAYVVDGDTIPMKYLPYINVVGDRKFKSKRESRAWARLKRNVKAAYPYAKLAGAKLNEYAEEIAALETERERKQFYKRIEQELKEEYEGDLKKLTTSQGRILIKLIDRETQNTSYELIQEMRGNFSAFLWQSLARIFGHNLKSRYDPYGEDAQIEQVVLLIEAGEL